jgi:uncharacterized membrane protein
MDRKSYTIIRVLIGLIIGALVFVAVILQNLYLALFGVLAGLLFLFLAKKSLGQATEDERTVSVSGMASRSTYMIVTIFLAVLGLMTIFSSRNGGSYFEESVGILLCYVAMLLVAVYSISYYYFNKKHGGNK